MAELSVNDLFHEVFDENERLINEFSVNKRYVDVLQKYRQLLTTVCSESDSSEDTELRQRFHELENEFKSVDKEMKTITAETDLKTSELRNQLNIDSKPKEKPIVRSMRKRNATEEEEELSAQEVNELDSGNNKNLKFLSPTDRLIEEDGTVITERDPKNPLILVVRMNDSSKQVFGFRCNWSDCQYVSVSKPKVDTHLRTVHDRSGLFVCLKCKRKFDSQKLLSTHLSSDHSKNYKCDYTDCGFQCRTRQHLTDHLRRHTGEKPYVCAVEEFGKECGKAFATRQELRKHNNGVHSEHPFRCDWPGCDLTFKNEKGLTFHNKTHIL